MVDTSHVGEPPCFPSIFVPVVAVVALVPLVPIQPVVVATFKAIAPVVPVVPSPAAGHPYHSGSGWWFLSTPLKNVSEFVSWDDEMGGSMDMGIPKMVGL